MSTCAYCGGEISFRYIGGNIIPMRDSCGCSSVKSSGCKDDVCRPTRCPKCSATVFFLRHNFGSVWLDSLGWPWPKHACFDNAEPPELLKCDPLPNADITKIKLVRVMMVYWSRAFQESFVHLRDTEGVFTDWKFSSDIRRSILKRSIARLDENGPTLTDAQGFIFPLAPYCISKVFCKPNWLRL